MRDLSQNNMIYVHYSLNINLLYSVYIIYRLNNYEIDQKLYIFSKIH